MFMIVRALLVFVGLGLMFWGLAMGVTIVMLPIGIVVGFMGLGVLVLGLFGM